MVGAKNFKPPYLPTIPVTHSITRSPIKTQKGWLMLHRYAFTYPHHTFFSLFKTLALFITALFIVGVQVAKAQVVTTTPEFPTSGDSVTVFFDATEGTGGLEDFDGTVYAHTGVITDESGGDSDWKYVISEWEENIPKNTLEQVEPNLYKLTITPSIREFYGVPEGETIEKMAFVFRNADGSKEGKAEGGEDIFVDVYESSFNVKLLQPDKEQTLTNTLDDLEVVGISSDSTSNSSLTLLINGQETKSVDNDTLNYTFTPQSRERFELTLAGSDGTTVDTVRKTYIVTPEVNEQDRPDNLEDGITYVDDNTVRLSLFAPNKEFVYVIGDFNNWEIDAEYFMNRETVNADSSWYWIEIDGLEAGKEYGFQYLVDGNIRVADPYSEKVLQPDDQYISEETYPNLKEYPGDKTEFSVGVLQPGKEKYEWKNTAYDRPENEELVIYELLVRDFIENHDYKTLTDTLDYLDRLGVNAIELMPVMEFEGNISWGYNPAFLMAPDKYYGPAEDLKAFIDSAHSRDMVVVMDIVLNHVYGQSPLARLWNEGDYGQPTAENPYLNIESPNQEFSWGYDFNHESKATQYYVDRVTRYWIEEFNADGYRFDFTKGFTQNPGGGWERDSDRIRLLKRMADRQWAVDDSSYVILEHLTINSEEKELADYGMLLWGNINSAYNEATMGYHDDGKSDFSGVFHKDRGWSEPNLIGYMESHDEERLMYKNLQFGTSSNGYDITEVPTALNRQKLAGAFFFTIPGPKMIWQFGELGYDVSIDENGRTGEKPILWEYREDENRYNLYKTWKALIELRKSHDVFSSAESNATLDVHAHVKRITLSHEDVEVSIVGNFGVSENSVKPKFAQAGKWYTFFGGDSIQVADTDTSVTLDPGKFRIYSTKQFDSPDEEIITDIKSDGGSAASEIPGEIKLRQNFPNPFNPTTRVRYELPESARVTLEVFDMAGRKVATLVDGAVQQAGSHTQRFDGSGLSSGIYFTRLEADGNSFVRKMTLIK